MKVEQFESKNQFIIRDFEKHKIIFQSYNSTIAIVDNAKNTLTLGQDWDYSKTTSKYLYLFINDCVSLKGIQGYSLSSELRHATNKRAYIQKCIEKGVIKYDSTLQ